MVSNCVEFRNLAFVVFFFAFPDPNEERESSEVTIARNNPPNSVTTVKMVNCE